MQYLALFLLVNLAVGVLACFFGRRLFYLALGAIAFLAVLGLGLNAPDPSPTTVAVAVVAGVVAALLSKFFYKAGVFISGALAGLALGVLLLVWSLAGAEPFAAEGGAALSAVVLVVCAVGVGALAVAFSDLAIRATTAVSGASLVVGTVTAALFCQAELQAAVVPGDAVATIGAAQLVVDQAGAAVSPVATGVAVLALAVAGFVVQGRTGRQASAPAGGGSRGTRARG